eukprot:6179432-Pleurochrysis_carterae.AAC.1
MQKTYIPTIDHSLAFASLYSEYVDPPPDTRKRNSSGRPLHRRASGSPTTRLSGRRPRWQTQPRCQPSARVYAHHARRTTGNPAKRAAPAPLVTDPNQQRKKHNAAVGQSWVVSTSLYPQERCDELGSLGRKVTIHRVRPFAVQVSFENARLESGQQFERVWHKLVDLRYLADQPSVASTACARATLALKRTEPTGVTSAATPPVRLPHSNTQCAHTLARILD